MYAICLSCPSATFALQHAGFVPREWLAAKDLFRAQENNTSKQNGNETAPFQGLTVVTTFFNSEAKVMKMLNPASVNFA